MVDEQFGAKRGKSLSSTKRSLSSTKKSFLVPVKTMGRIVDGRVKPSLHHQGGMWFSGVASGDYSFAIAALDTLHTVFSVNVENSWGRIEGIASKNDMTVVYTSLGYLLAYERGNEKWESETGKMSFLKFLLFDEFFILVSKEGHIQMRSLEDGSLIKELKVAKGVTEVLHPNTHLNKLLVGFEDGHLELWNISSEAHIYTFNVEQSDSITCLAQSPDADVVAVGGADGTVVVMNIKTDQELGRIKCEKGVCSVGFRYDSPPDDAQIMTADAGGIITIWSIMKKARTISCIQAHSGPILMAAFLSGQPIIISYGVNDNSMKEWIAEAEGRELRLLRSREGPHHPIENITFIHEQDHAGGVASGELVCVGRDESIVSLALGLDTKIHRFKVQIPASTNGLVIPGSFRVSTTSFFTTNNLGWDDGVCLIDNQPFARTLCKRRNANGSHLLLSADKKSLCGVKMSSCGHFCVIASTGGLISVFNMQSGVLRAEFKVPEKSGIIHEVSFDGVSRDIVCISSTGLLCVFSIKQKSLLYSEQLGFAVAKSFYRQETDMLYLLTEDFEIRVYDLEARRIVRVLEPPYGMISNFVVTPDFKWLLACMPSGVVLLYDLISGIVAGQAELGRDYNIRCITVSTDGEYIATVKAGCNYADLWWFLPHSVVSSSTQFPTYMALNHFNETEVMMSMCQGSMSRFLSFLDWQKLKEQSKPRVPLKKSSNAPFFLSELAAAKPDQQPGAGGTEEEQMARVQQLTEESDDDEIRQFLLESSASQLHDEMALASGNVKMHMAQVIAVLSSSPVHFDRSLALLSVLLQYLECTNGQLLEEASVNLQSIWSASRECLLSALNAIRYSKGRTQH